MTEPPDDAQPRATRPIAPQAFGAVSVAIGAMVLAGWAFDSEVLKSVVPGLIAMKPNAALGFVLGGLALGSIRPARPGNRLAAGLAGSVAAIGAATLFEYLTGVDLGIDQALAREPPGAKGSLNPGRMHPTTAFDFALLGAATLLIAAGRGCRTAHAMALLAALVAGSALIGYAYGLRQFHGLAVYNQMALHTTIGMLAMAVGVLTARPGSGLMGAIADDGAGGLMARRLLPVAILLPFTLDGLALLANRAQLFDERFAAAVRVIATIAIFVGSIGWNAHSLRRLDRARRRSDQALRLLADAMPQIAWTARPDGGIDYCNRRGLDYTGLDFGRDDGWGWRPAIHPDDLARSVETWGRSVRSGERYEIEYRLRRSDGAYRWHLSRAEPMLGDDGQVARWFGTSTDVHDQKLAGEQRFRSLVEATSAIVWNTPASGEFEAEQAGWSAFTGQSFAQLRGWGWLDSVHPEDRPETVRVWSEALASRSLYQVAHRLRRLDGEYRHMLVRAVPILTEGRAICEWVGVHTDVDTQKRAEVALREAKEAAEAATRAKGEFLANMSHEIRTPMNGILGMTELTLGTELTPRQREYLGLVKSSADALLTVIDDILDFSKIEAGKLALDPIPFGIRDAVTDTLRTLALRAHDKGLELACRIAPEVPESVVGDPGRLRQILINLVGNAIKFTERGEVCVAIETEGTEGPGHALLFSVADTGIGIPAGKRAAIFAPFEQADGSTTRKYGGTGLGLTISNRLVGLMGGRIWSEDNPGGGSVFRFTVRLAEDPEPGARAHRLPADPAGMAGLRVLIVDDNRTNRLILEELLGQWGCRAIPVPGGLEALEALGRAASRGEPFGMILLDRMMPGMDGCTLADRVHADPALAGIPMLMLTSGGPDESVRFRELGIGGWLAKPIRHSELFGAMLDLIEPIDLRPRPAEVRPAPEPGRRLRVLLAEDHPINQKVASRMLESLGHEVAIVGDGRAAVAAAGSGVFDIILMDVQMPEMDGFEALAAIRLAEGRTGHHIPIVALTAHAMAGDRERCLEAGFDDYLSKPIQAAGLRAALGRLDGPGPARPAEGPGEPRDGPLAFDRPEALECLGGDEDLLAEVLGLFLDDCPRLAAEIRAAIGAGDSASLKRLGHTVAGVAGNLAAPEVVASARRLEAMGKAGDLAEAEAAEVALGRAIDGFRAAVGPLPGSAGKPAGVAGRARR